VSKVLAQSTHQLDIQVINWDQYLNVLERSKVFHTVEEYVVQTSTQSYIQGEPPLSEDATYKRDFIVLEELEDPSKKLREQFMSQLKDHKIDFEELASDFQESVELAVVKAIENFTNTSACAIVYLNEHHGYKHWMLAPTTKEDLIIKMMNYSEGALVVYRPTTFTLFKVKA
jgi:hypothetical protein